MHKVSTATVTSGPTASTATSPEKDMKEIYMLGGLVLFLAIVVAGFWYYSQADEAAHSNRIASALSSDQVVPAYANRSALETGPISPPTLHMEGTQTATRTSDVLHDDIFFEINRRGLTDDGKAALERHAEFLKHESDWGVLVQGFTDQQGSMSFNKTLGLKRAEAVKQHLMALGVAETAIRTVSLGEEGALCIDSSDTCRRMNRRVHLELRKIGQDHLVIPTIAPPTHMDPMSDLIDADAQADTSADTNDGVSAPSTGSPESVPIPLGGPSDLPATPQ